MTTVGTFSGSFPKVIKVSKREWGVGGRGVTVLGEEGGKHEPKKKKG